MLDRSRDCTICLREWDRPLTCIPCGHVFCLSCLNSLMKLNNWHERWFRMVPCPLCRQLVLATKFVNSKDSQHLTSSHVLPGRTINRFLPRRFIEHALQFDKIVPQLDTSSLVIFLTLIFLSFVLTVLSFIPVYQYYIHDSLFESSIFGWMRDFIEFVIATCLPTISLTLCAVVVIVAIFVW